MAMHLCKALVLCLYSLTGHDILKSINLNTQLLQNPSGTTNENTLIHKRCARFTDLSPSSTQIAIIHYDKEHKIKQKNERNVNPVVFASKSSLSTVYSLSCFLSWLWLLITPSLKFTDQAKESNHLQQVIPSMGTTFLNWKQSTSHTESTGGLQFTQENNAAD